VQVRRDHPALGGVLVLRMDRPRARVGEPAVVETAGRTTAQDDDEDQDEPALRLSTMVRRGWRLTNGHPFTMATSLQSLGEEDLVQDTLLWVWRSADQYDATRASLRTWLHRIATNACLTALEGRSWRTVAERARPGRRGPADTAGGQPGRALAAAVPGHPARRPRRGCPAARRAPAGPGRLAAVAACSSTRSPGAARGAPTAAAEVAQVLDSSVASVNSSLQRARATLRAAGPVLEMPPVPFWLAGRSRYRDFMERVFVRRGTGWRLLSVSANGSPALAAYARTRGPESPGPIRCRCSR
jgi:hypothetical protein